jgi:hypothetical protein
VMARERSDVLRDADAAIQENASRRRILRAVLPGNPSPWTQDFRWALEDSNL